MTARLEGLWLVMSPEWRDYNDPDDPLVMADAVEVFASSARKAITVAVRRPEMARWVEMQRAYGRPPFAGLRAEFITAEAPE